MNAFAQNLLEWYNPKNRNLPWKKTKDAYKIWLSEIIMQQTRVEQGTPYYLKFVEQYPSIKDLANAPLDDILKLWEGLGYYSRARNLQSAAKQVVEQYNGKFPNNYEDILKLKGVGNYTAAAVASFAYNVPFAVVDGNVFRVLSRVFGVELPIDSNEGKKYFQQLAQQLLDKKNPAKYNQAIMDFGALVCKPKNPLCDDCPFQSNCKALASNKIDVLPIKSKKLIKTDRFFHYFVLFDDEFILIQQRTQNDIWKDLFEFPLIETKNEKLPKTHLFSDLIQPKQYKKSSFVYKQTLSHQHVYARFYEIKLKELPKPKKSMIKIEKSKLFSQTFPKIVRSYLEDRFNYLS
ncbi:MAG: A/G-specific adenine glycosylase [Bacteroidetes bacterium]|nr:A/G-specific adenine glycosylase [Bacteroidota bacterium]